MSQLGWLDIKLGINPKCFAAHKLFFIFGGFLFFGKGSEVRHLFYERLNF